MCGSYAQGDRMGGNDFSISEEVCGHLLGGHYLDEHGLVRPITVLGYGACYF